MITKDSIALRFREVFQTEPLIVRSPGRINIIGEHTDYNEGFVLPAAIDKAAYVGISRRSDDRIRMYAVAFDQLIETDLKSFAPSAEGWPNYILGVVDQLISRGHQLQGFDLLLDADVPIGAGLSSSAAVECAVGYGLNELFSLGIDRRELVDVAQMAEHKYAGVMCGIMDQFASVFGKKDHAVKLDCRSIDYEYIPLQLEGLKLLLLNTNVKHSLSGTAYNKRREECEQGVAWVNEQGFEFRSLRGITLDQLDRFVKPKDVVVYRRCRFVVEENERLQLACDALRRGDMNKLGELMYRTHEGLSREYEVSCLELDVLVEAVHGLPGIFGARMMGGGFGGCTINLVKEEAVDGIIEAVAKIYREKTGLELSSYVVTTADGSSEMA